MDGQNRTSQQFFNTSVFALAESTHPSQRTHLERAVLPWSCTRSDHQRSIRLMEAYGCRLACPIEIYNFAANHSALE